jgi:disulfide oxidoreductase YuzD
LLCLQPLLDRVYRNGRFRIDYVAPCKPALRGDDLAIAADILKRRI